jgi:hypothetical protein
MGVRTGLCTATESVFFDRRLSQGMAHAGLIRVIRAIRGAFPQARARYGTTARSLS